MKKILAVVFLIGCFMIQGCGGCENQLTKMKSNITKGDFRITLYSGGKMIKIWEIQNGYVNTEEHSDGWFFNYNGKLVRVSGDVIIEEI